jgi:hypothetical protein
MSPKQAEASADGILAHAHILKERGVPFDDYRVRQLLDSAIDLYRGGFTRKDWEPIFDAVLLIFEQPLIDTRAFADRWADLLVQPLEA